MRPCLNNMCMNSSEPFFFCMLISRSNRELRQSLIPIFINSGSDTIDSLSDCWTTAGSCLWSPMKINLSMAVWFLCLAHSIPSKFGSRIWDASSIIARSKCLMPNKLSFPDMLVIVPTNTWVSWITLQTISAFGFNRIFSSNRFFLKRSSQDNSEPILIYWILCLSILSQISSTARLV